jgi:hypothetical protein
MKEKEEMHRVTENEEARKQTHETTRHQFAFHLVVRDPSVLTEFSTRHSRAPARIGGSIHGSRSYLPVPDSNGNVPSCMALCFASVHCTLAFILSEQFPMQSP